MPPTKRKPKRATPKRAKPAAKREWPANASYDRGVELINTDARAAAKLLAAAAKRQPKRARIHVNLAWALSNLGEHAKAKAAAQRAHALDATDAYIAARRVHVLFAGSDDAVIDAARHAMQIADMPPEDRRYAHAAICWTLMRTAPAEAMRETEKLVTEWPDEAEALAARGCALAGACRWDEGVTWLDMAIRADPSDTRFPLRRETIIEARDTAETALVQLRARAQTRPDDAKGWRELGLALARFARLDEALEAFEHARALDADADDRDPLVVAALMVEATARTSVLVGDIAPIG